MKHKLQIAIDFSNWYDFKSAIKTITEYIDVNYYFSEANFKDAVEKKDDKRANKGPEEPKGKGANKVDAM